MALCLVCALPHPYALDLEQEVRARIWCTLDNLQADASEGEEHQWVVNQIRSVLDHAGRSRSVKAIPGAERVALTTNGVLLSEQLPEFVMGVKDMSQWDSFVQTLKDMDIERCIELKQSALDRYQER